MENLVYCGNIIHTNDADYAGYNNNWKIVTRYIVIVNRVATKWSQLSQKHVKLLVPEYEYLVVIKLC